MILVTGGAGFIGSNFVLATIAETDETVVTLDKLTYAGNTANLSGLRNEPRHRFFQGDIADRGLLKIIFDGYAPRAAVHFAAESHVDRSIDRSAPFIQTNVAGTGHLLDEALAYFLKLGGAARERFRFLHVSTDEVYGALGPKDAPFTEKSAYAPNNPYAASKAGADHLVRSYQHTYGLPTLITNAANNYGPRQFPEKLIPLMLRRALAGKPMPVYGDGANVRDWLYVHDHCRALRTVLDLGRPGETYNIGASAERTNNEVVRELCAALQAVKACERGEYSDLVVKVPDRPGHDFRYALDARKVRALGWKPVETFASGIEKTVRWYVENSA